jgi:structural maintenance of chromosome 1
MPVLRLELENFKSYGGRHVIPFDSSPLTCIIGPNGSGKSNVMDAVSFVLGVSSQKLRSTQLLDLVWRKPETAAALGGTGSPADENKDREEEAVDKEPEEVLDSSSSSSSSDDEDDDESGERTAAPSSLKPRSGKKKTKGSRRAVAPSNKLRASASLVFQREDDDDDDESDQDYDNKDLSTTGEDSTNDNDDDDSFQKGGGGGSSSSSKKKKKTATTTKKKIITFTRVVTPRGACEYRLNDRQVSWDAYQAALASIGVLVKVRNCLVFQGDVEALARKRPGELVQLVEEISGSAQLASLYDECHLARTKAEQAQIDSYKDQKSLRARRRAVKALKDESERYQSLLEAQTALKSEFYAWMLYHMERKRLDWTAERDEHREEWDATQERVDRLHSQLAEAKKSLHASRRSTAQVNKKRVKWQSKLDGIDTDLTTAQQQADDATIKLEADGKHLAKARVALANKEETVQRLSEDLREAQETLSTLQKEYDEAKTTDAARLRLPKSFTEAQEAEYEQLRQQVQVATDAPRRELAKLQRKLDGARSCASEAQQRLGESRQLLEEVSGDVQHLHDRVAKLALVRAGQKKAPRRIWDTVRRLCSVEKLSLSDFFLAFLIFLPLVAARASRRRPRT